MLRKTLLILGITYGILVAILFFLSPPEGTLVDPDSYTREDTLAMARVQDLLPADIVFLPGQHILDHAGLLHPATITTLEQNLGKMHERGPMRVAVVTVPGTGHIAPVDYANQLRLKWDEVYPSDEPSRQHALLLVSPRRGIACFFGQTEGACLDSGWVMESFKGNDSVREATVLSTLRWGLATFGKDSAIGEIPLPSPGTILPRPTPLPRLTPVLDPYTWRMKCLPFLGVFFVLQIGGGLIFHFTRSILSHIAVLILLFLPSQVMWLLMIDFSGIFAHAFFLISLISVGIQAPSSLWREIAKSK